jgi:hypothetical protein
VEFRQRTNGLPLNGSPPVFVLTNRVCSSGDPFSTAPGEEPSPAAAPTGRSAASPAELLDQQERLLIALRDRLAHEACMFDETFGREQLSGVVHRAVKPGESDVIAERAKGATDVATSLAGLERDERAAAWPQHPACLTEHRRQVGVGDVDD